MEARDGSYPDFCKAPSFIHLQTPREPQLLTSAIAVWKREAWPAVAFFSVRSKDLIFLKSCFWSSITDLIWLATGWSLWRRFYHQRVCDFLRIWTQVCDSWHTSFCSPHWWERVTRPPAQAHLYLFPQFLWLQQQYMKIMKVFKKQQQPTHNPNNPMLRGRHGRYVNTHLITGIYNYYNAQPFQSCLL